MFILGVHTCTNHLFWNRQSSFSTYLHCYLYLALSHNIRVCQVAKINRESYGALVEFFESVESLLRGLIIHIEVQLTPYMTETDTKILAELLSVLALATKQVNEGQFSMSSPFRVGISID